MAAFWDDGPHGASLEARANYTGLSSFRPTGRIDALDASTTFETFGRSWTSGKLASRFADHVKKKSSSSTGHKSSQMIYRYKRAARTVAELNLGALAPLNEAIPELR